MGIWLATKNPNTPNSMNETLHERLVWEGRTVEKMVVLYCKHHHQERTFTSEYGQKPLCADCHALLTYALKRIEACRYGANKPTCANCTTHCYKPVMRESIRQVMRYAGPRMLLYHPLAALKHTWLSWTRK